MAQSLPITGWPSNENNVKWSANSEVAVAIRENITIFIPKLSFDFAQCHDLEDASQWHKIEIEVNIFSWKEFPLFHPSRLDDFSIGEEQSQSFVEAIEWSAPGMGKLGQCVLAVLTTKIGRAHV